MNNRAKGSEVTKSKPVPTMTIEFRPTLVPSPTLLPTATPSPMPTRLPPTFTPTPSLTPTPKPTVVSTPTPAENYTFDKDYPIILSVSDDKGNIIKKSAYNNYQGLPNYSTSKVNTPIKSGDTFAWQVEAQDPHGRTLNYSVYTINDPSFDWTSGDDIYQTGHGSNFTANSNWQHTFTIEELKEAQQENQYYNSAINSEKRDPSLFRLIFCMKEIGNVPRQDKFLGPCGQYDDLIFIDYQISVP